MSATRDDVKLNLLHILPAGTAITATVLNPRRDSKGLIRTSIRFYSPNRANISEAVAIVLNSTYSATDQAVRGTFGGLSPQRQAVSELSRALHGSSTALHLSPNSPQTILQTPASRKRSR